MAFPSPPEEQPLQDVEQSHSDEFQSTVPVEGSQYQEISQTQLVPIKSGPEDVLSETDLEGERPVSAGTGYSSQYDFENTDDAALFASLDADAKAKSRRVLTSVEDSAGGPLLARPDSSDGINADTAFSFAKAARQQMDLTGTRKGPVSGMTSKATNADEASKEDIGHDNAETQGPGFEHSEYIQASNEPLRPIHVSGSLTTDDGLQAPPTEAHSRGHKRKKKKRKRRYDTAPTERVDYGEVVPPIGITTQETLPPMMRQAAEAGSPEISAPIEPSGDLEFDQRPGTPNDTAMRHDHGEHVSSPHGQLHEDLQTATQLLSSSAPTLPQGSTSHLQEDNTQMATEDWQGSPQPVRSDANEDNTVDHGLHRVSDRPVATRVSERKPKSSRKATAPTPTETEAVGDSSSDINDYLQIMAYKIREHEQSSSAKFAAERESLQVELQQAFNAKQVLQDELDDMSQQKLSLNATVEKQKDRMATLESNIKRLKTFVDGLGKDVDSLKKDANATRRKNEQLVQEKESRKAERDALFDQMNVCAERSSALKNQALKVCQEAQSELHAAVIRGDYLDMQLDEKVGLLAEERDRRAQLERQLTSAAGSEASIQRMLKSSNDAMLDKLYVIHVQVEESLNKNGTSKALVQTLAAVQALASKETATVEDVASVKVLIQALDESLTNGLQVSAATQMDEQSLTSAFKEHLEKGLNALKVELGERENLIQQEAAHRETVHSLQEQLKASNVRIARGESQISDAKLKENELKEQNATLQARIKALQSKSSPTENAQAQLNDVKAELDMTAKALDSAKADVASKARELLSLSAANTSLQEQLQALQSRLKSLQKKTVDFGPERKELERKARTEEERIRKEMAEHIENFEIELKTKSENDLKKLTSERNRLERQVKPLQDELVTYKTRIQQLQKEKSNGVLGKEQELERTKKLVESQKQEIDTLQSSLTDLQTAFKGDDAMQKKYSNLSTQFNAQQSKLKSAVEEKSVLLKQVDELRHASEEAELARKQAKSEFNKYRTEKESTVKALEKDLAEAKAAAEHSAAGLQHLKESCDKAIDDTSNKCDRQIKALQEQLSESQADLQKNKTEDERFRAEVEQTWQQEQKAFEERSTAIRRQVAEAEAQRDEAFAKNERLRQESETKINEQRKTLLEQRDQSQQRAETAEEKLKSQQRPSSKGSNVSSRLHVPSVKDGTTPTASLRSMEPPRMRKKVDRNNNAIVEVDAIPAPEEIRPDSRKTSSGKGKEPAKGPVVEESQFVSNPIFCNSADAPVIAQQLSSSFVLPSDNDDMLSIRDGALRQLPDTVEETQFEDRLPSFATFNRSVASMQIPTAKQASSTLPTRRLQEANSSGRSDSQDTVSLWTPADFVICEDSQDRASSQRVLNTEVHGQLQESLTWDQPDMEKYTFQKSLPQPNSASKMVYPDGRQSHTLRRGESVVQDSLASSDGAFNTPNARRGGKNDPLRGVTTTANTQSSSPDFVHNNTSGRKRSATYHTPGETTGKRRHSRTTPGPTTDPRLALRNPLVGSKRKSEGYIVEGYEHERKKRLSAGSNAVEANGRSLRSQTQPSINDLPSFPTMHAGPRSSQNSQSRMRTLAGGSSRTTRGAKKVSQNDEFNSRFSQELDGR